MELGGDCGKIPQEFEIPLRVSVHSTLIRDFYPMLLYFASFSLKFINGNMNMTRVLFFMYSTESQCMEDWNPSIRNT